MIKEYKIDDMAIAYSSDLDKVLFLEIVKVHNLQAKTQLMFVMNTEEFNKFRKKIKKTKKFKKKKK